MYNGGAGLPDRRRYLYDWLGYLLLVLISTAFTALAWFLVPLVKIDRIEARARQAGAIEAPA
jgi:hypothetical protein